MLVCCSKTVSEIVPFAYLTQYFASELTVCLKVVLLHCVLSPTQATGARLVRQKLQLYHALLATSALRVVQSQSRAPQEPSRTERNRQPALSARQVGLLFHLSKSKTFSFLSLVFRFVPFLFC